MTKAAKMSSQPFPASLEVIEANSFHQISCASTSFDSTKEGSDSSNSFSSSSSSSDLMEDVSSSSSSSSSNGPLYQLSDLMAQLPIKRGLSKYYQGKSQSFTSLASVENLEDLAKRENPYRKRIKYCKSYCGGLVDGQRFCSPKTSISKKTSSSSSRGLFSSKTLGGISCNDLMVSCRPPLVPVQKDF